MDNLNLRITEMDERRGYTKTRADNMLGILLVSQGKMGQCSHALREDKVEAPENMDIECTYSDRDLSISRPQLTNENVRLKKSVEPMFDRDLDMPDVIDKRRATKKVVAADVVEESAPPQTSALNYQPKQRPQKRLHLEDKQPSSECLDMSRLLKETEIIIQGITSNPAGEKNACLIYNPQLFSGMANLQLVQGEQKTSGAFGEVIKVTDTKSGQNLIVKKVKKNARGEIVLEKNEIEVPLQFSDSANITKVLGLFWNRHTPELSFIMEDSGISLRHLVSSSYNVKLSEPDKIEKIILDVYRGLSHLANHGVTHCDIKPENICLNVQTWLAKLVDFGSSKTSQNIMTLADYKGITPEYLDSVVNKFIFQVHVLKNMNCTIHQLDHKDDVFSAGLVGLFLIMRMHPMIKFFTGHSDYPKDPTSTLTLRKEVIKKISELTQEMMSDLLDKRMSNVMKELLTGVLSLDRQHRWTATAAVSFLQGKVTPDLPPPHKLFRQGAQPFQKPQVEDLSMFVDLKKKSSDQVIAPNMGTPGSPDDQRSLGIAWKGQQPMVTIPGDILVPVKLQQMAATHKLMATQPLQEKDRLEPKLDEQDSKDHTELMDFFNVIRTPHICLSQVIQQVTCHPLVTQQVTGLPQAQAEKYFLHPKSSMGLQMWPQAADTGSAMFDSGPVQRMQQMWPQAADTGSAMFDSGPVQRMQQMWPQAGDTGSAVFDSGSVQGMQQVMGGERAVHGLTGSMVRVPGQSSSVTGVSANFCNVPNIDLIEACNEQARPKLRGARRSRASQD